MSVHRLLDQWYRTHLGRPLEPDHVQGYWITLLGIVLGLLGLLGFVVAGTYDHGTSGFWLFRQIGFSLAMLGGPFVGMGIILLLPLQPRAFHLAIVGAAISVLAIVLFNMHYPGAWNVADGDRSVGILGLYTAGFLVQFLAIAIYPLATAKTEDPIEIHGEDRLAPGEEPSEDPTEDPSEDPDETGPVEESNGTFELFEDAAEEWRWRLRHDNGNIIASSGQGYASKQKAQQGLESVKQNATGAAITAPEGITATFEVFEDAAEKWRWRLRHRNGNIIADGGEGYSSRSAVEEAIDRIQTHAPDADRLEYDPTAFEVYEDAAEEWRWRLRHRNGNILADSGEGYAARGGAIDGITAVREYVEDQDNIEVYEDNAGKWRWRLTAPNNEIIADSGEGYASKSGCEDAVDRLQEYAPEADRLEYDPTAFEVYEDNAEKWRWRLRHRNGNILADSGEGYTAKQKAIQGLTSVATNAPKAPIELVESD